MRWMPQSQPERQKTDDGFRLEEFKALRSEIVANVEQLHKWENFALVSVGTIYGAYFLRGHLRLDDAAPSYIYSIPPVLIVLMGFVRSVQIATMIRLKDNYLLSLEAQLSSKELVVTDQLGEWESQRRRIEEESLILRCVVAPAILLRLFRRILRRGRKANFEGPCRGWVQYFYEMEQASYVYRDMFWSVFLYATFAMAIALHWGPDILSHARSLLP